MDRLSLYRYSGSCRRQSFSRLHDVFSQSGSPAKVLPLPSASMLSSSRCRRSTGLKNIGADVRDVCGARVRQPLLERRPRGGVAAYVA